MVSQTWTGPVPDTPEASARGVSLDQPEHIIPDAALEAADDRTLVDACLSGQRRAFDVIVQRHRQQVYQLCYRFVGNHEDASDLAQEVFVRAYRGLRGFKGRSSLKTWLYRIAVNVSLNRVSSKSPQIEPLDRRDHVDPNVEDPLAALVREQRAMVVRTAIARLPNKQRATLILRVYQELPHDQIAAILGSSVGAVKANFFHALANLKRLLQ
jgi:RNA polymerase sigma-70 factor (ECF subfamily)